MAESDKLLLCLEIENFRLIDQLEIVFRSGVPVVLIGPNGSGKSSVLEAISLLSEVLADDYDVVVHERRGGPKRVVRQGAEALTIGVRIPLGAIQLSISTRRGAQLSFGEGKPSQTVQLTQKHSSKGRTPSEDSSEGTPLWIIKGVIHRRFIVYSGFSLRQRWEHRDTPTTSNAPATPRIRSSKPPSASPVLRASGSNLVPVLHALHHEHPTVYRKIMHHFQREFPFVTELCFPPANEPGELRLDWTDSRFGLPMSAEELSTGMVHFLCLLVAALQPAHHLLIAFDEPEAHLHPSAIRRFASVAEEVSQHKAILIATHSDHLLDALTDRSGVHTCTPTHKGTDIGPVNSEALDSFLSEYTLSELRARGMLDASNSDEPQ